jgi:hypothetical protein
MMGNESTKMGVVGCGMAIAGGIALGGLAYGWVGAGFAASLEAILFGVLLIADANKVVTPKKEKQP